MYKYIKVYLGITLIAMIITIWYTDDLELGWALAQYLAPAFGLVVGMVIASYLREKSKINNWYSLAGIVIYSLLIHYVLMLEEMEVGIIRHYFK